MITLIEAVNYRSLKRVRQPLSPFHVLVGPNASGKSNFLDVVAFLGRFVEDDLPAALDERSSDFFDLVWGRPHPVTPVGSGFGEGLGLAIEARIPDELRKSLPDAGLDTVRYELKIRAFSLDLKPEVYGERVLLSNGSPNRQTSVSTGVVELFVEAAPGPIYTSVLRTEVGITVFSPETAIHEGLRDASFSIGTRKSALGNLVEDEARFPVSTWLKGVLVDGVRRYELDRDQLRKPSPPLRGSRMETSGQALPWIVATLRDRHPERHAAWVRHVQSALPQIVDIRSVIRPEDRHAYLVLKYADGLEVPSWLASDGTLRMLALTMLAYQPDPPGIHLIEEPENGVHPRALEVVFQSLSSVYEGQVLLATHSPLILGLAKAEDILCFNWSAEGGTSIVTGSEHPLLRDWHGEVDLGTLYAGGVLG